MIKVLLVEDDTLVAKIILYYLEQAETYEVIWAKTGSEAYANARDKFDVILLDILLPDVNGLDLCSRLTEWHDCPIIFISCLDCSDTIVQALERGGDDFIVKPFDNKILEARIKANLRRANKSPNKANNILACTGFKLDANRHIVVKNEGELKLSSTEFKILSFLMQNPGQYYTPKELYYKIWGAKSYGDPRTVIVHIHNIRNKIEEDVNNPRFLKMEWGQGYYFDPKGKAN
ncbi:two component transcriptional regulator, winged helix family [Alkaliphilus metalliredigens QYMF]|uniref:Stage 0 sporulation protein A homolog n=1 Tax=Alkaliphilus metalliredigens (strain QYMF) TaxID=293826 RepID=A6TSH7_ALKMQ|nr:response regulator transcription factor [Alkaliphilus metalliredigens]ABR49145.1 two component transcriptional regulator, winged helix family [Alkaliphilus metalliredigens QYMF]